MNDDLVRERPFYNRALSALQAAHDTCFKHPERDVLGMSHGPFSGVNEALGIVAGLEDDLKRAESELSTLRARVREVVGPFAKAGELFGPRLSDEYDQCIYSPAAGDEYSLCGDHLRAARQLMEEVK